MNKKIKIILSIILLSGLFYEGSAQTPPNLVKDFAVRTEGARIRLVLIGQDRMQYELIPFETRAYSMVRVSPLQFDPAIKDRFLATIKRLPIKVHALEMMDQSIMFTFKGIHANQVSLLPSNGGRSLEIMVDMATATLPAPVIRKQQDTAERHYRDAMSYYKKGQFKQAIGAIHRALQKRKNYPEAYVLAGKIRLHWGQKELAKTNFRIALRLRPKLAEAEEYLQKLAPVTKKATVQKPEVKTADSAQEISEKTGAVAQTKTGQTQKSHVKIEETATKAQPQPKPQVTVMQQKTRVSEPVAVPVSGGGKSRVLQGLLFFAIVAFAMFWMALIWKYRSVLTAKRDNAREKLPEPEDFSRLLHHLNNRERPIAGDSPAERQDLHAAISSELAQEGMRTGFAEERPVRKSIDPEKRKIAWPATEKTRESLESRALFFASMGYSVEEIARILGVGKGEVKLMLSIRGKHIPMSSSDLRIEMAE